MKLGFVSAVLADLDLPAVLGTAAELGYACVEPMCWPRGAADRRYAGVTHVDVASFGADDARRVREQCDSAGVEFSGLGYYPNPLSADAEEAQVACDHLRRVIDAAAQLKLGVVNTFIGRDPARTIDAQWDRCLETWRPLIAHAESAGVKLGFENCPMLFTADEWPGGKNLAHSPAVWRRLLEAFDSTAVGLNYDPSHLVWQMIDPIKPLREFGRRVVHAHAKDTCVDREKLDDVGILATPNAYQHAAIPGRGEVDWPAFVRTLREVGYDGPVCVEVEDRDFEGSLESRKEALRQSAAFLQPLLADPGA